MKFKIRWNLTLVLLTYASSFYGQKSINLSFLHEGKQIYGTLQTPKDTGRFTTIIICPGSGANDRNGTLPMYGANVQCLYPALEGDTLRPYKQLAQKLVDSGFAVFRYDKIEYTYPSNLGTVTFKKLWLPFESAIEFLKTRDEVDPTKFVLIGHSEGSSLIPYVALRHPEVKGLISLAGARTPFDSILAFQLRDFARRCNGDTLSANAQSSQILQYYDLVRSGQLTGNSPALFGVSPDVWKQYLDVIDSVSFHYNSCFQKKLFIGLSNDLNVPIAELYRFKNEVTAADFWQLDGLIHYMNPNSDPNVSEQLGDTIVHWLRNRSLSIHTHSDSKHRYEINIYPNPMTEEQSFLQIHTSAPEIIDVQVIDAAGRSIHASISPRSIVGQYTLTFLEPLQSGVYGFKLDFKTGVQVLRFIVN